MEPKVSKKYFCKRYQQLVGCTLQIELDRMWDVIYNGDISTLPTMALFAARIKRNGQSF